MKHPQIKSSTQEIAKASEGDYTKEHLFALQTALELYDSYQFKIMEYDRRAEEAFAVFEAKVSVPAPDLSPLRSTEKRQQTLQRHHLEQNDRSGPDQITWAPLAGRGASPLRNRSGYEPLTQRKALFARGSMSLPIIGLAEARSVRANPRKNANRGAAALHPGRPKRRAK